MPPSHPGSPFWVPDFGSRFVGEGNETERLAAVLESIAFLLQENLDEMSRHVGPPARLVLSGGLAARTFLPRCIAVLAGVPVDCTTAAEATARGVASLAAAGQAGWIAPAMRRLEPVEDPALRARHAAWHAALCAAIGT